MVCVWIGKSLESVGFDVEAPLVGAVSAGALCV